jgi:hypothetical protein
VIGPYYRLKSARDGGDMETILTVDVSPGWLARWFGARDREVEYIGRHFGWRELPSHRRCDIALGILLSQFYDKWEYEQRQQVERRTGASTVPAGARK